MRRRMNALVEVKFHLAVWVLGLIIRQVQSPVVRENVGRI
jgi:hypothetical protein